MSKTTQSAQRKESALQPASQKGVSLVMAVSLGFFVSLWLCSMMAIVIPAYHRASAGRIENTLRNAAETGLEHVIAELNLACINGGSSTLDSNKEGTEPNYTELPDYVCGDTHIKVFISVANKRPPQSSWLFNPALDPESAHSRLTSIGDNGWRVLTATAVCGNLRKSLRCVLQPVYSPASSLSTAQIDGTAPYFRFGLFAIQSIQFRGTAARLEPFSSSALTQGGSHSEAPPQLPPTLSLPAGIMPPALEPPDDESAVSGQISGTDDAICSGPDRGEICRLGSIVVHRGSTLRLPSGDYRINNLKLEQDSELKLVPGKSGDGPVRLFVSGCAGKPSAVEIDGRIDNSSNIPSHLQIWYNGSLPVTMHGAPGFCGVLYAPNADVTVACTDTMRGALLGRIIYVDGPGGLAFDLDLLKDANLQFPVSSSDPQYRIFCRKTALKAVTWEEL